MFNWFSISKFARTLRLRRHKNDSARRGVAAVEMAVCLPLLMTMLAGIWEIGRLADAQQVLENAVHEGARQAAAGQLDVTGVQNTVKQYVQVAGMPITHLTVTVSDLDNSSLDPTTAVHLDRLKVTATLPFTDVRYSTTRLFTSTSTNITASSTWNSTNQTAYPTTLTVPAGY